MRTGSPASDIPVVVDERRWSDHCGADATSTGSATACHPPRRVGFGASSSASTVHKDSVEHRVEIFFSIDQPTLFVAHQRQRQAGGGGQQRALAGRAQGTDGAGAPPSRRRACGGCGGPSWARQRLGAHWRDLSGLQCRRARPEPSGHPPSRTGRPAPQVPAWATCHAAVPITGQRPPSQGPRTV